MMPRPHHAAAGNRLWEWFSVGQYGLGGYDAKTSTFIGHDWPPEADIQQLQGFKDNAIRFQRRTHAIALTVLSALAIGLGHPEDFFEEVRRSHARWSLMRLLRHAGTPHAATFSRHADAPVLLPLCTAQPFALDAEENPSFMAWNKYPAVSPDDAAKPQPPRLHAHVDMDVLTILYQRDGARAAALNVRPFLIMSLSRSRVPRCHRRRGP